MVKEKNETLKDKEPRRDNEQKVVAFQEALEELFEECGEE